MKRSEVIDFIVTNSSEVGLNLNPFDSRDIIEKVLILAEKTGMAPPEVAEPVKTSVLVATPQGYVEQVVEDSKVFVRKWEDEA